MLMRKWLFSVIVLFILFSSCSHQEGDILRVVSPPPAGDRSSTNPLRFVFSRAVVPAESTNVMMKSPFLKFTPDIPGLFIWQDTSTLIFSPDSTLRGDTHYNVEFNTSLLLQYSGLKSFGGDQNVEFSTQSFMMTGADCFYDRLGAKRQVGIKANLVFTYAVNPMDVQKYIRVKINDSLVTGVMAMASRQSKIIPVEIGIVTQTEKAKTITIDFDPQLTSSETNTRIKLEKPFTFTLPGIDILKIYGHDFGTDGTTGWITINTSQFIDTATARQFISVTPACEYTLEGSRNGFTLRGSFVPGSAYHILIKKGLASFLDAKTQNDYDADITFGNVKPTFRFTSSNGTYMLLGGQKKIDIKTLNLSHLYVRVSQVFQNNLTFFLQSGRQYDWDYDYGEYDDGGRTYHYPKYRYYLGNFGRQIWADSIAIDNVKNKEVTTTFDLSPYLKTDYKGFYLLEISNPNEQWRSTSKLISVSDIGMIVKESGDQVMVFTTNLLTTEPMPGATVNLISSSNQLIASAASDANGVARFDKFTETKKDFTLKIVTAQSNNDFNFLNLEDYRVETSRFDVDGKYENQNQYDAFLYGDRTLYRPGETIHVSGIVRNLTNSLPAKMPVKIVVVSPRGTTLKELQQSLNEEGSFDISFPTSTSSLTGSYTFNLQTGNNVFLSSYEVSVEDFVPDRMKINLKSSKETANLGDTVSYDLQALNFFGPPAAGRNYEFEETFDAESYYSKNFKEFRFNDESVKDNTGSPIISNGKTDNDGKASISVAIPSTITSTGLLKARGRVAVFDESGRPVYQSARTTIYPKKYFIGIRNQGNYYIQPNSPQNMQIIAVGTDDKPIDRFKAKIQLIRLEWHSALRQSDQTGALRYVSEEEEFVEKTDLVTLGTEPTEYKYSTSRSGDYRVRVSKDGDEGYNQIQFYSYSWGTSDFTSFQINPEARVDIVLNDSVYTPGEKAKILFKTPFSGKMLVTIERNQVYSYRYLDVVNNAASLEIPVEDRFLPNVYVSAVLFRKITDVNLPLLVGHGFAPLMVEKSSNRFAVNIKAPEKIRPNTKQVITVKAGNEKNIFVTLAAVDEGILQLKNYLMPNAYKYFYAKKSLQTATYDFFKNLLPEPDHSSSGGSDQEMSQRVNPLGVLRFKPVALWSGIVKTDQNGEANITLDIPEFNGELRLMALAYKGDRFGSAQKPMKVSDPVVITPALPRFLSPNDTILMPITAFNTTEKPVTLQFEIETSGGIKVLGKPASLDVPANQERHVSVPMTATNQIGKATVIVTTDAFGETIKSTTDLPVRPIAPYASEAVSNFVEGGHTVTHNITDAYMENGRKAYITISPFPVANFARELKYLIGYPHGCIEQTVSKAFPQIYLRDIAILLDPTILNNGSPTYFVNEAITKITSMQLHDGSFSYWPGGDYSYPWTTVYATHFLVEAKKAGYAVPEATLNSALNYIKTVARSKQLYDYYWYGPNNSAQVWRIADKTTIYALYVLAVGGAPDQSLMNFYRTEKSLLTIDTRYLLSAAFALSGDRQTSLELVPTEYVTEEPYRQTGGDFDSPIRANALILNILLETDLNNPKIAQYMDYLSKQYQSDYWYSTQDDAFTLLAFGKAARMANATKMQGTIKVGEKEFTYTGGNQRFDIDPFGKAVTLSMQGDGRAYYSIITTGIRTDGKIPVVDKSLQIRRDFFHRDGTVARVDSVKQNDLLIVRLVLNSSVNWIDNIAITDLLPAGFEVENPRITESSNYSFIKDPSVPQYMDIRDDRINFYTNTGNSSSKQFYYMVRAVSPGVYHYAPVTAEAMYDGNYYSGNGGGIVKVVQ